MIRGGKVLWSVQSSECRCAVDAGKSDTPDTAKFQFSLCGDAGMFEGDGVPAADRRETSAGNPRATIGRFSGAHYLRIRPDSFRRSEALDRAENLAGPGLCQPLLRPYHLKVRISGDCVRSSAGQPSGGLFVGSRQDYAAGLLSRRLCWRSSRKSRSRKFRFRNNELTWSSV